MLVPNGIRYRGVPLYTSKLHVLSILPFESGPLVSLLLRITAVQMSLHGCSYSTGVCEFVHGRPARNMHITCLRRCDERTCVITCVNKSLVHALESCPSSEVTPRTCCSANLSTFSRENSKSAGLVMHISTAKNRMQYSASQVAITAMFLSQNGLRSKSQSI